MQQHFVTFLSPGTFVSESDSKPIESWDVQTAREMAKDIIQRYNARPYGFYFTTRVRGPKDLDSRESRRSHMYYLGGTIRTYEEVVADNQPTEAILRSNMRINNYKRIITNINSFKMTLPLKDEDVVLQGDF